MSNMIPCRDPQKCGVKSHKPDTVTKCGLKASGTQSSARLSGGTPALAAKRDPEVDMQTERLEQALEQYDDAFRNSADSVRADIALLERSYEYSTNDDVVALAQRNLNGRGRSPLSIGMREEIADKFASDHPEIGRSYEAVDFAVGVAELQLEADDVLETEDGTRTTKGEVSRDLRLTALAKDVHVREYSEAALAEPDRADEMHDKLVEHLGELGVPEADRDSLARELPAKAESNLGILKRNAAETFPQAIMPEWELFTVNP